MKIKKNTEARQYVAERLAEVMKCEYPKRHPIQVLRVGLAMGAIQGVTVSGLVSNEQGNRLVRNINELY